MAELISVEGDALLAGFTNEANTFTVTMCGMNTSKLVVAFTGPTKPQVMLAADKEGNVKCSYTTPTAGEYKTSITFDDDHVAASPYTVAVKAK